MTFMYELSVNVRTLAEFSYLSGDIVPAGRALKRMREGTQAHTALQRQYPQDWQSEVAVRRTIKIGELRLTVQGRIDGLGEQNDMPLIEEIKSYEGMLADDFCGAEVHWAQAMVYAAIMVHKQKSEGAIVRLVYVQNEDTTVFTRQRTAEQLEEIFLMLAESYADFALLQLKAREHSCETALKTPFPFDNYREGQKKFMGNAYYAVSKGKRLLAQAPTGIGKTMAALYPAVRALGDGTIERIFYLTARTTQRAAAEDALQHLRENGLYLRAVTITAKEKICFCPGNICDGEHCPYAKGYFDRIGTAVMTGLTRERLDREGIETLAKEHTVCPFELSLDLAEQSETVICDYNYAFDPNVRLRRFFDGRKNKCVLLIDEAHNLPGRVSDMLSAQLDTASVRKARTAWGKAKGRKTAPYVKLKALLAALESEKQANDEPFSAENASETLRTAVSDAIENLRNCFPMPDPILTDLFFSMLDFERTAKQAKPDHTTALIEPKKTGCMIRLWRFDPSAHIRETMKRSQSAVLFSATLSPMDWYSRLCGLDSENDDAALSVPSPFPPQNRLVLRADVPMRHKDRENSLPMIVQYLHAMVTAKTGNYMVCCPSHALLVRTADAFETAYPNIRVIRQKKLMSDEERTAFLSEFVSSPKEPLLGFIAMGGVFAEGVDLPGDRLSGAAILSVGIPQICFERNILARMPLPAGGYDNAYVFPSVTRVAQAAGRVIRTETDRGVILLLDDRFGRRPYNTLYQGVLDSDMVRTPANALRRMRDFWENTTDEETMSKN